MTAGMVTDVGVFCPGGEDVERTMCFALITVKVPSHGGIEDTGIETLLCRLVALRPEARLLHRCPSVSASVKQG